MPKEKPTRSKLSTTSRITNNSNSNTKKKNYIFCYYVSGHGFGHATRVVQVASEILFLPRKHTLYIVSNAPQFIFQGAIDKGANYRHALIDAGVQQPRAYTVDRHRTIDDLEVFLENRPEMIKREVNWLKEVKADIVLSDAPFLPCAAASAAGIPSAIVSNFTFDAVYSGLCEGDELDVRIKNLVEEVMKDYKESELLIRLPGYIPIPSFASTKLYPDSKTNKLIKSHGNYHHNNNNNGYNNRNNDNRKQVIDVPLVVRKSKTPRDIVLKNLGIPEKIFTTHKVLMVSFGGQNLVGIEEWGNPLPDDWIAIVCGSSFDKLPKKFYNCPKDAYIPDLTNAADAVIGKLGYGTCSECIGHSKPLIYVPRPQFIEELGLRKLMEFQGISLEMPKKRFERGEWKSYIIEVYNMSKNINDNHNSRIEKLKHNGGEIAAKIIENYLDDNNGEIILVSNNVATNNNNNVNGNSQRKLRTRIKQQYQQHPQQ